MIFILTAPLPVRYAAFAGRRGGTLRSQCLMIAPTGDASTACRSTRNRSTPPRNQIPPPALRIHQHRTKRLRTGLHRLRSTRKSMLPHAGLKSRSRHTRIHIRLAQLPVKHPRQVLYALVLIPDTLHPLAKHMARLPGLQERRLLLLHHFADPHLHIQAAQKAIVRKQRHRHAQGSLLKQLHAPTLHRV